MLNALRIAVLIAIGAAGAPLVAVGGFHSQAGWIAFNAVAVVFCLCAQRIPWVSAGAPSRPQGNRAIENPTAAYLMPFLAILAASMISRAAAGGFEWLYPLRFFAGAATLWFFRARYRGMEWRFGWLAPAAGGLVFVLWLVMDRWAGAGADNGIASGLASWPTAGRITWLGLRTAGAVITVPIAEELAFRGFLIRRAMAREFDALSPRSFTLLAVLVSSVGFGLMHGNRWPAGTAAGLVYAAVYLRRGRIGEAVAAHVTTNALLAGWVLMRGAWNLW
jgi:exosortase E/protease (VPEID-CTERM system)